MLNPRPIYIFQINICTGPFSWKCYYDENILFSFSLDSDLIFCKNAPWQLLRLNFKNNSYLFLTTISHLNCPPLPDSESREDESDIFSS